MPPELQQEIELPRHAAVLEGAATSRPEPCSGCRPACLHAPLAAPASGLPYNATIPCDPGLPPFGRYCMDPAQGSLLAGLWELTKPRLSFLSVVSALVAYLSALPERNLGVLLHFLCGTAFAAGGAAALNQWIERGPDALMRRTRNRPIPAGQVTPAQAIAWGAGLSAAGCMQLWLGANPLAASLAAATILSYLFVYTPLKRRTRWAVEIGAVSGALPPLIGWAAARGTVDGLGWVLFAVLYFWQIPHFMAIAWMYRRDYAAGGFALVPVSDRDGRGTARWALAGTLILVIVSLVPVALRWTGWPYAGAAIVLGGAFAWLGFRMAAAVNRDGPAKRLFLFSIFYLPALSAVLVLDRLLV